MAGKLRSVDTQLGPAVHATLRALQLRPEDAGAVKLAAHYAQAIDDADDPATTLAMLGPKLLAVLESLGATPKARAALQKGDPPSAAGKLDRLRAARGA
jgi:hypothetical protein